MPSLNQSILGSFNILGAIKAKNKNTADKISAQRWIFPEFIRGNREIIKNTIENTIPNDFSEDGSIWIWLEDSDID